jgi:hypothetical protein
MKQIPAMAVVSLIAGDTSVVIILGALAAITFAALVAIAGAVVFAIGDGDPVADAQQYIELTEDARRLIPPGPAFSDPEGATTAAIGRFLATKEEARQALWASRRNRTGDRAAVEVQPQQPHRLPSSHRRSQTFSPGWRLPRRRELNAARSKLDRGSEM